MRPAGSSAESRLGLPEYRSHALGQKIALGLLSSFILAALAGVFGDGPLSDAHVTSPDGQLRVDYQRFGRRDAEQTLDITLLAPRGSEQIELSLDQEYLRRVQITEIFPAPLQSSHQQAGRLSFATDRSGTPILVRLHLQALRAGVVQAHLTAGTASKRVAVDFEQLVYP